MRIALHPATKSGGRPAGELGPQAARVVSPEAADHVTIAVGLTAQMDAINPFDFFLEPINGVVVGGDHIIEVGVDVFPADSAV
jgi:hypothetical protein